MTCIEGLNYSVTIHVKSESRIICLGKTQGQPLSNYQILMKRQKFRGQTIDKTIAKPAGVIKNQGDTELEKGFFQNKALRDLKFSGMVVLDRTLHSEKIASHIPLPW